MRTIEEIAEEARDRYAKWKVPFVADLFMQVLTARDAEWQAETAALRAQLAAVTRELAETKEWEDHAVSCHASSVAVNDILRAENAALTAKVAEAETRLKEPHPARDFVNEFNDALAAKDKALTAAEADATRAEADAAGLRRKLAGAKANMRVRILNMGDGTWQVGVLKSFAPETTHATLDEALDRAAELAGEDNP